MEIMDEEKINRDYQDKHKRLMYMILFIFGFIMLISTLKPALAQDNGEENIVPIMGRSGEKWEILETGIH